MIGAHADYNRDDFMFAREQRRGTRLDVKSPPPLRGGIIWLALYAVAIVAAVAGAVAAYANRPYPKWRAW